MPQILESPQRLRIIVKTLQEQEILQRSNVQKIKPEAATVDQLLMIHDQQLIEKVKNASLVGGVTLTSDTVTNEYTYDAARYAAGGAILAGNKVINERSTIAYALTRPPGHHATRNQAMGFCFFNNIAICAKYLLQKRRINRIVIIDLDNHYGNGTADLFYDSNEVLTISLHADPLIAFPYQGRVTEIGEGVGKGFNICMPLPESVGDQEYLRAFETIVPSVIREFKPDVILVSMGYDGMKDDPYGFMALTPAIYYHLNSTITSLANELCEGKIALVLEGGYNFEALGAGFLASIAPFIIKGINDEKLETSFNKKYKKLNSSGNKSKVENMLQQLKKTLKPYWKID
jgi:acetoin utilization deacetylase AcuC-like enzyme